MTGRASRRLLLAGLGAATLLAACGRRPGAAPAPPTAFPAAISTPSPVPAAPTPTATLVPPRPTVTPTPRPPTPTPVAYDPPRHLEIPKLGVSAPVASIGTLPGGELEAPKGPDVVGWFASGPRPGEPGNALLTGHLDWAGPPPRPAVFWRLRELVRGDALVVRTERDHLLFEVDSSEVYARESAPADRILGFAIGRVVTLLTCEGTFLPAERDYTHRRVVRARFAHELP